MEAHRMAPRESVKELVFLTREPRVTGAISTEAASLSGKLNLGDLHRVT
jgi:hypothetical protein